MRPIWKLVTESDYLDLSFNDINVHYTSYINNHKHSVTDGELIIEDAVQAGHTPGKNNFLIQFNSPLLVGSVKSAHVEFSHAMILDNIRDGQFIFKNTYSENKKFTIPMDDPNSPDEFFFVHVELTDE